MVLLAMTALCSWLPLSSAEKELPGQAGSAGRSPPLDAEQQGAVIVRTLFDVAGPSVRQALCQKDRAIYDQISFYFPIDSNYLRVRAGTDDAMKRAVEVSSGYVDLNSRLIQAMIYSADKDVLVPEAKNSARYIEHVARVIRYRSRPVAPGMRAVFMETYSAWAGIPHDEYTKVISRNMDLMTPYLVESFVFTILHEIGHHVLGHPNLKVDERRSRDQEWAADLYALAGVSRLGLSSFGTVPYFMLAAEIENEDFGDAASPFGTHDPSNCRLLFILNPDIGIDEVERKRNLAARFCARDLEKIRAARGSKDRSVCFRPE